MSGGAVPPKEWYDSLKEWKANDPSGYYIYTGTVNGVEGLIVELRGGGGMRPVVGVNEDGTPAYGKHWYYKKYAREPYLETLSGANWGAQIVEQMAPYVTLQLDNPLALGSLRQEEIIGKLVYPG